MPKAIVSSLKTYLVVSFKNSEIKIDSFQLEIGNLEIEKGITNVVGENGSGKTVFLKSIIGFTQWAQGHILIDGVDVQKNKWQEKTAVYFDDFQLIPYLTVREYFDFIISFKRCDREESKTLISKHSELLNLTEFDKQIRDLSEENQKKVGLISSLLGNPSLVIWDEPFANLDEKSRENLNSIIEEIFSNSEKQLIYATNLEFGICDATLEIKDNKIVKK